MTLSHAHAPLRLLDFGCKAGGCSVGYHRAGFEVMGLDIEPQPHYPFAFILGDMLTYPLDGFDAYHASPPCQDASLAAQQWRKVGREYQRLIGPMRERLRATEKPYVIENVVGADLINPVKLNGASFGLNVRRTRLFECNFPMPFMLLLKEPKSRFRMGRRPHPEGPITPVGHFSGVEKARLAMRIDWYMNQEEVANAIPPAYTEYIGKHMIAHIRSQHENRSG